VNEELRALVACANETFGEPDQQVSFCVSTYYDLPAPDGKWKAAIVWDEKSCYVSPGHTWRRLILEEGYTEEPY